MTREDRLRGRLRPRPTLINQSNAQATLHNHPPCPNISVASATRTAPDNHRGTRSTSHNRLAPNEQETLPPGTRPHQRTSSNPGVAAPRTSSLRPRFPLPTGPPGGTIPAPSLTSTPPRKPRLWNPAPGGRMRPLRAQASRVPCRATPRYTLDANPSVTHPRADQIRQRPRPSHSPPPHHARKQRRTQEPDTNYSQLGGALRISLPSPHLIEVHQRLCPCQEAGQVLPQVFQELRVRSASKLSRA